MAAKTFQCVICQVEVSKPQSYAYKDGRACRHHPEVQEAHTSSEQAKKEDLQRSKHRAERPAWNFNKNQPEMTRDEMFTAMGMKDPNKHCWSCHEDGVYEHIIMERYLVNMSKAELKSDKPVSPFEVVDGRLVNNQEVRTAVQAELGKDKVALRRIEVNSDYPDWKLKQVINQNRRQDKIQLVRMTGIIVLCKCCAKKFDFPWQYATDKIDKSDFTKMALLGHLIKPAIDSIAAGEIASEAIADIMKK